MQSLIKILSLLAALIIAVQTVQAAKYLENKPDVLKTCHLKDSDFNKCFAKSFQVLFHEWKDGIPGNKAVGSLDPLHVKRILISQDALDLKADLRNVVLLGASKTVVKEARFNPKTLVAQIKLFLPKLHFDCDYKLKGHILNLVLNGNGKALFEIEKFSMLLNLKLKLRDEYGHTFTDIEKLDLDITDVGDFHVNFENLFNGEKALEDSTNAIFNENWRDFYEILRPAITKSVEAILDDRLSKAFSYLPADYFIEDIPKAAEHSA